MMNQDKNKEVRRLIGFKSLGSSFKVLVNSILLVFLSTSISFASEETEAQWLSEWESERSEGPISSQCRQHKSKILQCRFNTVVEESFEALTAVILDVEGFKEWAVSVMVSDQVVYDEHDKDLYVYTTYDFTGAYDRDALTRYSLKVSDNGNRNRINFITVDKPYEPEDLRLVRFPLMAGYWQFTRLENGKTEIEHQSFTQPGGVVQSSLYPLFNVAYLDSSFDTIRALQAQSRKAKYSDKQYMEKQYSEKQYLDKQDRHKQHQAAQLVATPKHNK